MEDKKEEEIISSQSEGEQVYDGKVEQRSSEELLDQIVKTKEKITARLAEYKQKVKEFKGLKAPIK